MADDSPQAMFDDMKPDDDAIKLFVGQVPHDATEADIRAFFGEYGSIYQIGIIRNKDTGTSKGCCFLTYHTRHSAIKAMKIVNDAKIMPGGRRALQVRPANGAIENEEDRRLFVGMLGKLTTDEDLRNLFSPFGNIESSTILKERDGTSRGCAFVTFTVRKNAMRAVESLDRSRTLEGCTKPLVVKFADTQKDKERKAQSSEYNMGGPMNPMNDMHMMHGMNMNPSQMQFNSPPPPVFNDRSSRFSSGPSDNWNLPSTNIPPPSLPPMMPPPPMASNPMGQAGAAPNIQQLQAQIQGLTALAALAANPVLSAVLNPNMALLQQLTGSLGAGGGGDMFGQALTGLQQYNDTLGSGNNMNGRSNIGSSFSGMGMGSAMGSGSGMMGSGSGMTGLSSGMGTGMGSGSGMGGFGSTMGSSSNSFSSSMGQQQSSSSRFASRDAHLKVPAGCNLFIYQLPPDYRESDIEMLFAPFGKIVSSRVPLDKATNRGKGYGFVSFDSTTSAQNAIKAMNGHVINGRKLQVQIKGPRDGAKPY